MKLVAKPYSSFFVFIIILTSFFAYSFLSPPVVKAAQECIGTGADQICFETVGSWETRGSAIYYTNGNVGIGNDNPMRALDVAGKIRSSQDGYEFPDNTVQITAGAPASGSANYIQNQKDVAQTADFNISGTATISGPLTLGSGPTDSMHAATKQYVDTYINGLTWKPPVAGGAGQSPEDRYGVCNAEKHSWATFQKSNSAVYVCSETSPNTFAWVQIGSTLSIPFATKSSAGKVQVGDNISVDNTGKISLPQSVETTASPSFRRLTLGGLTLSSFTTGSLLFVGGDNNVMQDNANLFWDKTNNRLGIGTTAPDKPLHVSGAVKATEFCIADDCKTNWNDVGLWTQQSNNNISNKNSGNVGIGTSAPTRSLDLAKTGQIAFGNRVQETQERGIYWHEGNSYGIYRTAGAWTGDDFQQLKFQFATGIQLGAGTGSNTGYNKSYVEIINGKGLMVSSGNVGIGTTAPNKLLHLKTSAGTNAELDIQSGTKGHWGIYQDETSEELRFWNNNANRLTVKKDGALDVQGAAQFGSGNIDLINSAGKIPGISSTYFASVDGSALTSLNAENLSSGFIPSDRVSGQYTKITGVGTLTQGIWNANSITAQYTEAKDTTNDPWVGVGSGGVWTSGNVGIGKNDPSAKLEVAGTVKAEDFCIGDSCLKEEGFKQWQTNQTKISYSKGAVGIGVYDPEGKFQIASPEYRYDQVAVRDGSKSPRCPGDVDAHKVDSPLTIDLNKIGVGQSCFDVHTILSSKGKKEISFSIEYTLTEKFNTHFSVSNEGTVGIGIASATHLLSLWKPQGGNAEITLNSTGESDKNHWGIYHDRNSRQLRFWNGENRLTLTSDGVIGIGQTTSFAPGVKLAIASESTQFGIYPGYKDNEADQNWVTLDISGERNLRVRDHLSVEGNISAQKRITTAEWVESPVMRVKDTGDQAWPTTYYRSKDVGMFVGLSQPNLMAQIGASTNHPLGFYTNNSERMKITNEGKIGIGTANPSPRAKLHISGSNDSESRLLVQNTNTNDNDSPAEIVFDRTAVNGAQKGAIGIDKTSRDFFIWVNGFDRLNINENGNVGVGIAPSADFRLNVRDAVNVVFGKTSRKLALAGALGNDIAELFDTEEEVEAGDVVAVGTEKKKLRKAQGAGDKIVGIVSEAPAILFEGSQLKLAPKPETFTKGTRPPIALAGRVLVKVSGENGAIAVGDYLAASLAPGIAAKADQQQSTTLGVALEPFDGKGTGKILVFINVDARSATLSSQDLTQRIQNLEFELEKLKMK